MVRSKSEGLQLAALTSLFLVFSLISREFLRLELLERGLPGGLAGNVATFSGIAILALTAWPLLGRFRLSLAGFFRRPVSVPASIFIGLGCGLSCRLLDWLFLLSDNAVASRRVAIVASCARPDLDTLALAGFALPVAEEVAHRGLLLAGLAPFGIVPAILVSALVFAMLHTTFVAPFLFGILAAILARRSGALWIPVIAHSTFNLANSIEAACIHVMTTATGGMRIDPLVMLIVATALLLTLALLIRVAGTGAPVRPGTGMPGR